MFKNRLNPSIRPLSARALKSTLDTLRPYLLESSVLDLFAGQGRFGTGAIQEGAEKVVFIELHPPTADDIKKTIQHPSLPKHKAKVHSMDVWRYLETATDQFDIVFADPPFDYWNKEFEIKLLTRVVRALKQGSIFLVKHPKGVIVSSTIEDLRLWKTAVFGESGLTYFRYGKED